MSVGRTPESWCSMRAFWSDVASSVRVSALPPKPCWREREEASQLGKVPSNDDDDDDEGRSKDAPS